MTHSPLMPDCKPTVVCFFPQSHSHTSKQCLCFWYFPCRNKDFACLCSNINILLKKKVSTCRAWGSLWIIWGPKVDDSWRDLNGYSCLWHSSANALWKPRHLTSRFVAILVKAYLNKKSPVAGICVVFYVSNKKKFITMSLLACLGAAAGVALCRPIPREAAGGNHCPIYQSLKHPPPDT